MIRYRPHTEPFFPGKLKNSSGPSLCGITCRTDRSLTACLFCQNKNVSLFKRKTHRLHPLHSVWTSHNQKWSNFKFFNSEKFWHKSMIKHREINQGGHTIVCGGFNFHGFCGLPLPMNLRPYEYLTNKWIVLHWYAKNQ